MAEIRQQFQPATATIVNAPGGADKAHVVASR